MASSLAARFAVAAVGVPILLTAVYVGTPWMFWLIIVVAGALAMDELFAMSGQDKVDRRVSVACGVAAMSVAYWASDSQRFAHFDSMLMLLVVVVPIALYYLFRFGDVKTVGPRFAASLTGIVYVGLLANFLPLLRRDAGGGGETGGHWVVFVLAVTWIGDTGAYFAGRFLGKHKLYPAVSPNKTWEGALGGLAASTLGAVVMKVFFLTGVPWLDLMLITIPGAALGQMGDLVESLLKRSYGVKDSGAILPGHGGLLDRIDAVLIMAPWVYCYPAIRSLFT